MLPIGHGKAQELMPPQGSPLASSPSPSTDDDFRHAPSVGRQPSEAGLRSMASLGFVGRSITKTLRKHLQSVHIRALYLVMLQIGASRTGNPRDFR